MYTKAIYDAIRKRTNDFGVRMRGDGLKPIGFLGGNQNKPRITDYHVEDLDSKKVLYLHVLFPKFAEANVLSDEDFEERKIRLPLEEDGGPAEGLTFSVQVNAQVFTGTIECRGNHWAVTYSVA